MRRGRIVIDLVVDLLSDEVDTKGDKGDAETRSSVTHLIAKHGMLPPLVPSPEKLSSMLSSSHFFRSINTERNLGKKKP
jgi:hypothetical protein